VDAVGAFVVRAHGTSTGGVLVILVHSGSNRSLIRVRSNRTDRGSRDRVGIISSASSSNTSASTLPNSDRVHNSQYTRLISCEMSSWFAIAKVSSAQGILLPNFDGLDGGGNSAGHCFSRHPRDHLRRVLNSRSEAVRNIDAMQR
jgi:hypothetical protein